jgi:hypothetical protein
MNSTSTSQTTQKPISAGSTSRSPLAQQPNGQAVALPASPSLSPSSVGGGVPGPKVDGTITPATAVPASTTSPSLPTVLTPPRVVQLRETGKDHQSSSSNEADDEKEEAGGENENKDKAARDKPSVTLLKETSNSGKILEAKTKIGALKAHWGITADLVRVFTSSRYKKAHRRSHGTIFLFPYHLCFASHTHRTKLAIPLRKVRDISHKKNRKHEFIVSLDDHKYRFSGSAGKTDAFQAILQVWNYAKGDQTVDLDKIRAMDKRVIQRELQSQKLIAKQQKRELKKARRGKAGTSSDSDIVTTSSTSESELNSIDGEEDSSSSSGDDDSTSSSGADETTTASDTASSSSSTSEGRRTGGRAKLSSSDNERKRKKMIRKKKVLVGKDKQSERGGGNGSDGKILGIISEVVPEKNSGLAEEEGKDQAAILEEELPFVEVATEPTIITSKRPPQAAEAENRVTKVLNGVSLAQLWKLVFSESFIRAFLTKQSNFDITIEEWKASATEAGVYERTQRYTKTVKGFIKGDSHVQLSQYLVRLPKGRLILAGESKMDFVPYHDSFMVCSFWEFVETAPKVVQVSNTPWVVWTKPPPRLLKGKIEKGSVEGGQASFRTLMTEAEQAIAQFNATQSSLNNRTAPSSGSSTSAPTTVAEQNLASTIANLVSPPRPDSPDAGSAYTNATTSTTATPGISGRGSSSGESSVSSFTSELLAQTVLPRWAQVLLLGFFISLSISVLLNIYLLVGK